MKIRVRRVDKDLPLPEYDSGAACFDLICREDKAIPPQSIELIPVNIIVEVPESCGLFIFARSSTPLRKGLMLANGVGVVDHFFSGNDDELVIQLLNFTNEPVTVKRGDKLAQATLIKREEVDWLEVEEMSHGGEGGYWATRK